MSNCLLLNSFTTNCPIQILQYKHNVFILQYDSFIFHFFSTPLLFYHLMTALFFQCRPECVVILILLLHPRLLGAPLYLCSFKNVSKSEHFSPFLPLIPSSLIWVTCGSRLISLNLFFSPGCFLTQHSYDSCLYSSSPYYLQFHFHGFSYSLKIINGKFQKLSITSKLCSNLSSIRSVLSHPVLYLTQGNNHAVVHHICTVHMSHL